MYSCRDENKIIFFAYLQKASRKRKFSWKRNLVTIDQISRKSKNAFSIQLCTRPNRLLPRSFVWAKHYVKAKIATNKVYFFYQPKVFLPICSIPAINNFINSNSSKCNSKHRLELLDENWYVRICLALFLKIFQIQYIIVGFQSQRCWTGLVHRPMHGSVLYFALQIWVWSVSNLRIRVEYTKLFLGSKYLIMRSKYFH